MTTKAKSTKQTPRKLAGDTSTKTSKRKAKKAPLAATTAKEKNLVTGPKQPIRFYLNDAHKAQIDEIMAAKGINVSQCVSMIVADWLEQQNSFKGRTELESFHHWLAKDNDPQLAPFIRALGAFIKVIDKRRAVQIQIV